MKLKLIILILVIVMIGTSCDYIPIPSETSTAKTTNTPSELTETEIPTPEITIEPTLQPTEEATPEPTLEPTYTPEPTPLDFSSLPPEDLGAVYYTEAYEQIQYITNYLGSDLPMVEEYCAYITNQSMAMDGQTDIELDYVEWLWGEEATQQYLIDYPTASPEDYEFIDQIGYIRNIDTSTVWVRTSDDSRYYLNRPLLTSSIGEVDYDEFSDWLFSTSTGRFVMVCTVDGVIARVEWIFLP